MNAKALVIVVLPDDTRILESDVAGRPACDYLLETLSGSDEAEVRVVVDGNTDCPGWFDKYRNISRCSPTELDAGNQAERGLLLIDARAWLSHAALVNMIMRTRHATNCLRIVEPSATIHVARREVRTLAVYLPVGQPRANLFKQGRTSAQQGLEQILDSEALAHGFVVDSSSLDASDPALLIASYQDLAELERRILLERAIYAMSRGVRIRDPNEVYIRGELVCGSDVEIEINVIIEGHVALGNGVKIGANSVLRNSRIGENTCINPFSLVEDSSIGSDSFVGPYGRIRPGNVIGDSVQIGNFVEIKNSQIGAGSRINHHTFIGDAVLADQVTIGAGTITCNHDGIGISQTIIERRAYIGSGCNLVAPLRIGEGATVGAGSTITRDVPAAKLTLARSPQTTIDSWHGPGRGQEQK
jgi:acetyltransferase-like isoleucine patch superfamily enzyme